MTVFALTKEHLDLVLDGCSYIFEQAAFQGIAPEALFAQLLDAGIDDIHSKVNIYFNAFNLFTILF